jgi:hypothetical protein
MGTLGQIVEAHRKLDFILETTLSVLVENRPTPFPSNPIVCALLLGATASEIDRKNDSSPSDQDTYYGDLTFLAAMQDEKLGDAISAIASLMLEKQLAQN